MNLEDYKDIVGTIASVVTIAQMFSGSLVCKEIVQKGTSEGKDPNPFIGGLSIGVLMFKYAILVGDPAMITVNIVGFALSLIYSFIFIFYTPNKGPIYSSIVKSMIVTGGFLAYAFYEDPEKLEFRWGLLVTCLLFLLIAAPLFNIKEIIRTKNTDILPFPMIVMGTLVSALWLIYGFIIDNQFMIFQNVVGFLLQIFQLSLFVIYPKDKTSKKSSQVKKDN